MGLAADSVYIWELGTETTTQGKVQIQCDYRIAGRTGIAASDPIGVQSPGE